MKIITNEAVYVQKNDMAYLNSSDLPIPASIFKKVFKNGMSYLNSSDLPIPASIFMKVFGNNVVIIDDSNRYEFVKFEEEDEIEFFKSLDWMIDYNEVKDLSKEENIALGQSIAQEKNEIASKFNSMSEGERKENMQMVQQCKLLDFKMYSLRDVLWFKQGYIPMELPEGINYPSDYIHERGIRKILKNIKFNKMKK